MGVSFKSIQHVLLLQMHTGTGSQLFVRSIRSSSSWQLRQDELPDGQSSAITWRLSSRAFSGFSHSTFAESITDMDVCDTGNSNDGTNSSFLYFNLIQTVKLIELADLNFLTFVQIMMV